MNDRRELVTIVTLTYRNFRYLKKAISSVLAQDYTNMEYIISDDGSDDFPEREIRNYVENNKRDNLKGFFIIRHEKNVGTVKNVNYAYSQANGEYLIPLSSDDVLLESNTISKIVDRFESRKCDALVTSRLKCDVTENTISLVPLKSERKYIYNLKTGIDQYKAFISEQYFDMASGSVLYLRKSYWEKMGGFDEKYILWEDGPFLEKIIWDKKLELAYDIISIRYHDGGVSSGKKRHPLLVQDRYLYDATDKQKHISEMNWVIKEKIRFDMMRFRAKDTRSVLMTYIRCPIGAGIRVLYKLKRQHALRQERSLIRRKDYAGD